MPGIQHILFPYDFSDQGVLAVPFVRALAKRLAARITAMSVVAPLWDAPPFGMPALPMPDPEEMAADVSTRLEAAFTKELGSLPAEQVVRTGDPALEITKFAHTNGVDLIMMPTHGFGMFRSFLIGSVTAKVLHDVHCPVWTATHAEEQAAPELPGTVLCAIDDTSGAPAVLQWAANFCQSIGATLKVIHVAPPVGDVQDQVLEQARIKIEALRQAAGVQTPIKIASGAVAETIAEEATRDEAGLLIIGRGVAHAGLGRLRTHVNGIVQKSPCPVLSV